MRFPFVQAWRREYFVESLAPDDLEAVAAIHREDFARPWSALEFAALLRQDTVFGFVTREIGRGGQSPVAFVLARLVAGEGEILTVAVAQSHRRLGLGWQLMDAVLRELHRNRADSLFLEVDEANEGAIALYRRFGFRQVGHRPGYYREAGRPTSGALVMRRDLR